MTTETETGAGESDRPEDATPVARLALRDSALALLVLSLWAGAEAWHAATGLGLAWLLSLVDGLIAGAAIAAIAHEWGHFAGARWAGGIAPTTPLQSLFPLFVFDMNGSDPAAFRAMSIGGNAAHWLVVLVFVVALPLDTIGSVALVSAAVGFAVFASATEIPVIRLAYSGASPAESFAGLTSEKLRRNGRIGAAVALLLLMGL